MARLNAQVWTTDLILGISIFTIVVVIYFAFAANFLLAPKSGLGPMPDDALVLSDTLLGPGNPAGWNLTNIIAPGITNGDYRINVTKLSSVSQLSYPTLKVLLKSKYDFIFFFIDKNNQILNISGSKYFGMPGVNDTNIKSKESPKNIVITRRLLIYQSDIVSMEVYTWA